MSEVVNYIQIRIQFYTATMQGAILIFTVNAFALALFSSLGFFIAQSGGQIPSSMNFVYSTEIFLMLCGAFGILYCHKKIQHCLKMLEQPINFENDHHD